MNLPNGYGTCYRLPGNRRRPFVVKKTVNGRQKILGYFDTFEHGIAYLSSVNASPLLDDDITFSELFARWKATKKLVIKLVIGTQNMQEMMSITITSAPV